MKAIFKTKSNYRNTNGKELNIVEVSGTRMTAKIPDEEYGFLLVDFSVSELVSFAGGFSIDKENKIIEDKK